MKLSLYILSILALFLATKPAIDAVSLLSANEQVCCTVNKCTPQSEYQPTTGDTDKDHKNTCSPFHACCSALFICIDTPIYTLFKNHISTKVFFNYQSIKGGSFISDFWHPPQFV